ncbi:SRPBCC family protein [Mycobacterium sp. MYCO198283]|uniref:SRPBCC family protein n=1 Tax=Mycobacterium sp. MYCO198283 TaxID=2883505 RepID=UPI001E32DDA6|nr:SRPBCC family protein [Mycobacterium sp. MYCO198283]MCG5431175.1 SRPBCC family protein [Mycobacterium sp. MYCO198283]
MAITASREVVIEAGLDEVLAVMLDLESLPEWSEPHQRCEVTERDDRGRPLRSRQTVTTVGITDEVEIALQYYDDGYGWSLVSSQWQRSQDARYTLTPDGTSTRVRFEVRIDPVMPMPGFLIKRASKGVIDTATDGLRKRVLSRRRAT